MYRPNSVRTAGCWIIILVLTTATAFAQAGRTHFTKAFIIDDRLSALRRDADMTSPVVHRLHIGRPVYIIGSKGEGGERAKFYRVAVTRRTRGWLHEAAIVVPGRAGEDARVMRLIEGTTDGLDRIALCRLFLEHFSRSSLAPRALLVIGEAADRAAATLTGHARRRLKKLDEQNANARRRDYYLNDSGLDRYSKLGVAFDFREDSTRYAYDGKAYHELLKRFPRSAEAQVASERLDRLAQSLARRK
jgi:hypothetical protein